MNKTKYEVIDIARAGANLILDASKYTKHELIDIAEAIKEDCTLHLFGCESKTKHELIDIVMAAPNKITLQ